MPTPSSCRNLEAAAQYRLPAIAGHSPHIRQHSLVEDDESLSQTPPDWDDNIRDKIQSAQSQPRAPQGIMSFQWPSFSLCQPWDCRLRQPCTSKIHCLRMQSIWGMLHVITCRHPNDASPTPMNDKYGKWWLFIICGILHTVGLSGYFKVGHCISKVTWSSIWKYQ